jgi:hypothetical protein
MQLTYRGQAFNRPTVSAPQSQAPGHLTHTLQYLGQTYTACVSERHSATPRAINWRYGIE